MYIHDFIFPFYLILFEHENNDTYASFIVPLVSDNRKSSAVLFVESIQSYDYVAKWFQLTYFYIISCFLKHNFYRFFLYLKKKDKFSFVFGAKLVSTIRLILFFDLPIVILCDIMTIYL